MGNDEIIKEIKKNFFSLRNGSLADSIKKMYKPGKIVMGLNLPQLAELSKQYNKNSDLGFKLWGEKNNRESRLFALYMIDPKDVTFERARDMILDVDSYEEGDLLPFKLLRYLTFATELYEEIKCEKISSIYPSYCIEMFKKNLDQVKEKNRNLYLPQ